MSRVILRGRVRLSQSEIDIPMPDSITRAAKFILLLTADSTVQTFYRSNGYLLKLILWIVCCNGW